MNWKTTVSGTAFVGALCTFLLSLIPTMAQGLPWLVQAQPYLALIAAIAGFINAYFQKDKDVTGGVRSQAGFAAPAILLVILFASLLMMFSPAILRAATLTFGWEQPDLVAGNTDFEGWAIFYKTSPTGTYQQLGNILIWDGTAKPTYSGGWTLTAPVGQETTYYFVARAHNNASSGGQWSEDSNIVSLLVDLEPPTVPTVTTPNPGFLVVGSSFTFGGAKEAGSSIWINGAQAVAGDSTTIWAVAVTVAKGANSFSITSKDAAPWLNESAATQYTFQGAETPPVPVQLKVTVAAQ